VTPVGGIKPDVLVAGKKSKTRIVRSDVWPKFETRLEEARLIELRGRGGVWGRFANVLIGRPSAGVGIQNCLVSARGKRPAKQMRNLVSNLVLRKLASGRVKRDRDRRGCQEHKDWGMNKPRQEISR